MKNCASLLWLVICLAFLKSAVAIYCYQCNSTQHKDPFQCNEYMEDSDLQPTDCSTVYDAKYCVKRTGRFEALCVWVHAAVMEVCCIKCFVCAGMQDIGCTDDLIHLGSPNLTDCSVIFEAAHCIKTTGRYGGGYGTRRFCSSLDLGTYCNYVKHRGDIHEYRSCIYTCSTDGCNGSTRSANQLSSSLLIISVLCLRLITR